MPAKIDETGNRYGRWIVIRPATKEEVNNRKGGLFWKCKCECGNEGIILGSSLRKGDSISCGCYNREQTSQRNREILLIDRTGESNLNYQGDNMTIIQYDSSNDMIVQFQDEFKAKVHCNYKNFKDGMVKNPFYPEVYNIGRMGGKYKTCDNGKTIKEYAIWHSILQRCYDEKTQIKQPTYIGCTVDNNWLIYDNFYDWIHSQENYIQWRDGKRWMIDKDIMAKGNKVYSELYCSLVPESVNMLFTKRQNNRGDNPIGVYFYKKGNCFRAQCMNPFEKRRILVGEFSNEEDAFMAYKTYKEDLVKKVAQKEFAEGNIIRKCYEAMMEYIVEITD